MGLKVGTQPLGLFCLSQARVELGGGLIQSSVLIIQVRARVYEILVVRIRPKELGRELGVVSQRTRV